MRRWIVMKEALATALSLPLAVFFLSSCATAKIEHASQNFDVSALSGAERLAVGPVVQVGGEPVLNGHAHAIRTQINQSIGQKRKYISLTSNLGPDLIAPFSGSAENAIGGSLKSIAKSKGVRYLILTELNQNRVSFDIDRDCEEIEENLYDKDGKCIGKEVAGTTYETIAKTTRSLGARFKVLDLTTDQVVWVSRSNHSKTSSNRAESCFYYPPLPPYPEAPDASDVGVSMSRAAVRKLPRSGWGSQ